jgi:DNA-binding protein WhiA
MMSCPVEGDECLMAIDPAPVERSSGADVKAELARVVPASVSARRAEVAALLRFVGQLQLAAGRLDVEVAVGPRLIAERLRKAIADLYGHRAVVVAVSPDGGRAAPRHAVRVLAGADALARQTGLLDRWGRPVCGLPTWVVVGSKDDAAAAWRGAFLACGSLSAPGRSPALWVDCPGVETAQALVGLARRLGAKAKVAEARSGYRAGSRDAAAIGLLLKRLGAHDTSLICEQALATRRRVSPPPRDGAEANRQRIAEAAAVTSARAQRALAILGDSAPEHLASAGRLRIQHPQASLEELARLADPPATKDTINGRIRRLLRLADRKAEQDGVATTTAGAANGIAV